MKPNGCDQLMTVAAAAAAVCRRTGQVSEEEEKWLLVRRTTAPKQGGLANVELAIGEAPSGVTRLFALGESSSPCCQCGLQTLATRVAWF